MFKVQTSLVTPVQVTRQAQAEKLRVRLETSQVLAATKSNSVWAFYAVLKVTVLSMRACVFWSQNIRLWVHIKKTIRKATIKGIAGQRARICFCYKPRYNFQTRTFSKIYRLFSERQVHHFIMTLGPYRSFRYSDSYKRYENLTAAGMPITRLEELLPPVKYNVVFHAKLNFCTQWLKCWYVPEGRRSDRLAWRALLSIPG